MARLKVRRLVPRLLAVAMVLFVAYLILDVGLQATRFLGLWNMPYEHGSTGHCGQWPILIGSVAILSFFTLAYVVPLGRHNWRSAGLVQGFIIALFTEMYGFPLTVYVLASLIGLPVGSPVQMDMDGHLLARVVAAALGLDPLSAASGVMALSSTVILVGFLHILFGWQRIYRGEGQLVTDGVYRYARHPQYTGILLVTLALLVHWPTIVTVLMWPILVYTYYRLARREERMAEGVFGDDYRVYRQRTPMFVPWPRPASHPVDRATATDRW